MMLCASQSPQMRSQVILANVMKSQANLPKTLWLLAKVVGAQHRRNRLIKPTDGVGTVFEKRLIEAYITESGRDPVTDEDLSTDDLVELRTSRIVRPRPPTLTSIPSLLSVFQNEWDSLALETYTLRQQLKQTRQELSTALYQHDAAVRVIARLSRERDEAREALARVSVHGGPATNGEAMQVDSVGLSSDLIAKVETTQEKYRFPIHDSTSLR